MSDLIPIRIGNVAYDAAWPFVEDTGLDRHASRAARCGYEAWRTAKPVGNTKRVVADRETWFHLHNALTYVQETYDYARARRAAKRAIYRIDTELQNALTQHKDVS